MGKDKIKDCKNCKYYKIGKKFYHSRCKKEIYFVSCTYFKTLMSRFLTERRAKLCDCYEEVVE